jgi:thiol-disulfide isomerase/thioredoxin
MASRDGESLSYPFGVAALVVVLLLAFAFLPRLFARGESAFVGKDAPELSLAVAAQGETAPPSPSGRVSLSELRGKVVLMDFWATWCGPCQAELPIVDSVARRYADRNVVVLGVNTSDEEEALALWLARHKRPAFTVLYDQGNMVATRYEVQNLPTLVLVSPQGKIVAVRQGVTDGAELEKLVERALD